MLLLISSALAFAPSRLWVGKAIGVPKPHISIYAAQVNTPADTVNKVPAFNSEQDEERVRTVCVALLGQFGKVEKAGVSEELDFKGFSALVDDLEVECSDEDKSTIFAMIDEDGSGSICAQELKGAMLSSGTITTMYQQSLKTFGALIAATLVFAIGIYFYKGSPDAFDFLTGYVIEDSLSVDNLFVFLLIFRYFKVPPQLVDVCLNYGIAGSIVLRGVFIFAGLAAVQQFQPILLGFSVFLLFSSYQMLAGDDADGDDEDDEDEAPPEIITDLLKKLPLTGTYEGEKLFVAGKEGQGVQVTQLTAALVCIALSDVLFAVDSIPAVLAVTSDPFIVYTSNIAAVAGLRSLYQLLSVAVSDLVYLEPAVAIVLGFVGLKLGLEVVGYEVSSGISLGFIIAVLGGAIVLSKTVDLEKTGFQQTNKDSLVLSFLTAIQKAFKK